MNKNFTHACLLNSDVFILKYATKCSHNVYLLQNSVVFESQTSSVTPSLVCIRREGHYLIKTPLISLTLMWHLFYHGTIFTVVLEGRTVIPNITQSRLKASFSLELRSGIPSKFSKVILFIYLLQFPLRLQVNAIFISDSVNVLIEKIFRKIALANPHV